jgi:hypothetical protein
MGCKGSKKAVFEPKKTLFRPGAQKQVTFENDEGLCSDSVEVRFRRESGLTDVASPGDQDKARSSKSSVKASLKKKKKKSCLKAVSKIGGRSWLTRSLTRRKKPIESEKDPQSRDSAQFSDEALPGVEARPGTRRGFTDEALPGDRVEARHGRRREGQFEEGERGTVLEGGFEDHVSIVLDKTKKTVVIPRNRFFDWFQFLDKPCRFNVVLTAKIVRPSPKNVRIECTSKAGEHLESWTLGNDATLMTLRNHIEKTRFVTRICKKIGMEHATARFMFEDGTPVQKMFRIVEYECLSVLIEFQPKIEDMIQSWTSLDH